MLKGRSADMARDVDDDAPPRRLVTNDDVGRDESVVLIALLLLPLRENALAVLHAEPRRRATRSVRGIEIRMIFYPSGLIVMMYEQKQSLMMAAPLFALSDD